MFTRCSHCQKSQKLNAEQLRESRGFVTCDSCGQRFDALPSLVEDARKKARKGPVRRKPQPDLLHELRMAHLSRYRPEAWAVGCVAMLMLLLAQWFYFEGHVLTEQAKYYQVWQSLCQQLHCTPPAYRQLNEINLLESEFVVAQDQTWLLTTTMTNQATFEQSTPRLRLQVQDFNGHDIAERVFQPQEYGAPLSLSVHQSVPIQLRIAPLAKAIAGYHLSVI